MSDKKIREELEELAPRLASLKEHVNPVVMPTGFVDSLYADVKPEGSISRRPVLKYLNALVFSGIAASIVILTMFSYSENTQEESLPVEIIESYVSSNVDEYEEFISEESIIGVDWMEQELEDIPENQLISYLENNLDQIDLENFIPIQ